MIYHLEENLKLGKFVTAKLPRQAPIYSWFSYPHSFSRELVHELLDLFGATTNDWVLDPYVGAGTTLLACREKSIPALGIDELPLSVFVSNTKVQSYNPDELNTCLDSFSPKRPQNDVFGSVPVVDIAFTQEVRAKISEIYGWATDLPSKPRNFFLLALLSILEEISQTAKSGGWLKLIDNTVDCNKVVDIFKTKARLMISDLRIITLPNNSGERWYAVLGDARKIEKPGCPIRYVITSPPYLNRHDYTRVFALEMALHFVRTNADLIAIRSQAMRSHVEAKPPKDLSTADYHQPQCLKDIIQRLRVSASKADRARVPKMVEGYFEDMYACLRSLSMLVESGGAIAFVLGNVRFSGVSIPVDEIVAEIGEQVNLRVEKIIIARYRGNSAQQMKEFGRDPARESIIIWRKSN
ncbi:MAG: DNA methylase [Pelotomaculum sp. PtaB.Bin104]|nr:MAG: DNA methylase [Pelotomaculum sp. PtaB.Bin104]